MEPTQAATSAPQPITRPRIDDNTHAELMKLWHKRARHRTHDCRCRSMRDIQRKMDALFDGCR